MLLLIRAPVLASGADDFHYFRDEAGEHSLGRGGGGWEEGCASDGV